MNDPTSNHPESLSVSELSQKLKRTLEQQFDFVRIRGELSRVKIHTSGHLYTDLKDENAVINAVCWRGTVSQLSIKPEEGLEVICTGKITTYPARSNYQLVIESMELAGQGALLKMLEERKKKLQAEGLFDPARKRALPFLPETIGIITSPTGAVIQDILHRLGDRFPRRILLWPAAVQGENTVRDVIAGIKGFHALPKEQRPDVLIVARGGGSLEDLMPFNDEAIVRAIAASEIPTIAAIGHETDVTLIELAADRRAPTPSAAAEMAVPVRTDLIYTLSSHRQRMENLLQARLKHDAAYLRGLKAALGDPAKIVQTQQQRVDFAGMALLQGLTKGYSQWSNRFSRVQSALRHPKGQIDLAAQKLKGLSALMESYSFKNVLARGFALVTDKDGHVVSSAKQAKTHPSLKLTFADDSVTIKPNEA
jgi:exodeoxyribonuclease VII large subunit